jgi:hypothetical protein
MTKEHVIIQPPENYGAENWADLPITGDLTKDISIFLSADMCCGPYGCAQDAAVPLLKRALKGNPIPAAPAFE